MALEQVTDKDLLEAMLVEISTGCCTFVLVRAFLAQRPLACTEFICCITQDRFTVHSIRRTRVSPTYYTLEYRKLIQAIGLKARSALSVSLQLYNARITEASSDESCIIGL